MKGGGGGRNCLTTGGIILFQPANELGLCSMGGKLTALRLLLELRERHVVIVNLATIPAQTTRIN